ncbi:hypothetical protein NSU_3726 [Novosphingobium pentaromativorans US6-1]|uniref:Uncharacterized protein n=1 Tax=Novosphingobium pentaromativorans US6-1 TaxID=1088721 RepID=G6EHA5_9SPHN|nr:hypothetical protein NSU_3726 [Novosphingobium pentaromativorans US6-1]
MSLSQARQVLPALTGFPFAGIDPGKGGKHKREAPLALYSRAKAPIL